MKQNSINSESEINKREDNENIPNGVSIENASYIESNPNNDDLENLETPIISQISDEQTNFQEEHTPKLFSEDSETQNEKNFDDSDEADTDKLFDHETHEDEDFEIPAFLRKQKF